MESQQLRWLAGIAAGAALLWLLDAAHKPPAGSVSTGSISNVSGRVVVAGTVYNGMGGALAVEPPPTCGCLAIPRY